MKTYEFTLRLNREVADDEIEQLYVAGCHDAAIETGPLGTLIQFDREARSLAEAVVSAVQDLEKIEGLRAIGVACDNIVTLLDIAERVGKSREAVRLWATGQRGPGGFPHPTLVTTGGEKLWDWQQVATWVQASMRFRLPIWSHVLILADRVLAARDALRSEPDDSARRTLEQLLTDA